MSAKKKKNAKGFAALAIIILMCTGCSTRFPRHSEPNARYLAALESTAAAVVSPEREEMSLTRLMDYFRNFNVEALKTHTREVYAEKIFFRDGFKEIHTLDALEAYMVHSAEPLRTCTFDFAPPIKNGNDYYLRWTMKLSLKRDKKEKVEQAIGMSHIRLNQEGKVVFQQDYWDPTDVLYRRIPVARSLIGYVRSKL